MKQSKYPASTRPAPVTELSAALAALSRLGVTVVARCPAPACPVCRQALAA